MESKRPRGAGLREVLFSRTSTPVAELRFSEQASFLSKAYAHLMCAVAGVAGLEAWLFKLGTNARWVGWFPGAGEPSVGWIVTIVAYIATAAVAVYFAHRARTMPAQYAALALFVVVPVLVGGGYVFGFSPENVVVGIVVALACAAVIDVTPHVPWRYAEDRFVAAGIALFASALLFVWTRASRADGAMDD